MKQELQKITNSNPIPHILLPFKGSDSGHAQGEAAGERSEETGASGEISRRNGNSPE